MEYEVEVRKILSEQVKSVQQPMELHVSEVLHKHGMDSLGYIRLIVALEDYFDIEVEEEYLDDSKNVTIQALCQMLKESLKKMREEL